MGRRKKSASPSHRAKDGEKSRSAVPARPGRWGLRVAGLAGVLVVVGVIAFYVWRSMGNASPPAAAPRAEGTDVPEGGSAPAGSGTARVDDPPPIVASAETIHAGYGGSASCRECHKYAYEAWEHSNHAMAERGIEPDMDAEALAAIAKDHPELTTPERVIGHDPLRQFLVGAPDGRLQAHDTAYDPHKEEWFNVFGDEKREAGEWGHWTGRGLNWNSMCAACHNTRLLKGYERASDTYATTMVEVGIGCESCHGPMKDHVEWQRANPILPAIAPTTQLAMATGAATKGTTTAQAGAKKPRPPKRPDDPTLKNNPAREAMFDTCASCHSRRGELTGDFKPGDSYHDHYRLSVVDESDLYYADGQVRDEDFEMAAFLGSRMYTAGVRCADCHNAHTGEPVVSGDFMCMRCHQGIETYPTAPIIKPLEHTFHKPDGAGARCVNCHMPQTTYMQRHVRHDHGFTIPDPLMTIEHGIPNACNRCHADKDAKWSADAVQKWYGQRMERPYRARTRVIAAAKAGQASARDGLMAMFADEKLPTYWKAVAAGMLGRWVGDEAVTATLLPQLGHADPLVRANAIRSLELLVESRPEVRSAVQGRLGDPRRSVRLAAAWALRAALDPQSRPGRELLHNLETNADQPIGRLQGAHYHLARGDAAAALSELAMAITWDPRSAGMRREMAVALSMTGRTAEAIAHLEEACRLAPEGAEYRFLLGLAYNEMGNLAGTVKALEEAVRLDPSHAAAWYNLGLSQHAGGQSEAALTSLSRAESADASDPRIPYARATILAQGNRHDEARAAAQRALDIRPDFQPALQLLSAPPARSGLRPSRR